MSWGDILPYWGGDAPVLNFNPRQLQVLNTVGFLGIAHEADSLAFLDILGEIPKNPWQSKGPNHPPNCHVKPQEIAGLFWGTIFHHHCPLSRPFGGGSLRLPWIIWRYNFKTWSCWRWWWFMEPTLCKSPFSPRFGEICFFQHISTEKKTVATEDVGRRSCNFFEAGLFSRHLLVFRGSNILGWWRLTRILLEGFF